MDSRHAAYSDKPGQRRPTTASSVLQRKPVPSSSSSTSPPPSGSDRRALAPGARSCTYTPPHHHQASQPLPPCLRSSKSTSNLSSSHRYRQGPQHYDSSKPPSLPPGFIVEDVPSRAYESASLLHAQASSSVTLVPPDYSEGELWRAKSASDITTTATTSSSSLHTVQTQNQQQQQQQQPSAWKKAVDDVQYFAGSIIARAAESTKHYTVIRHSRALVWYRGPATTVTISVLSDKPLPSSTRSVWLQQRGHSGNMGMSVKALLGVSGTWIDVTPAAAASATDIPAVDERGIQRDFRRFATKATGKQARHQPRETLVVRIPASCEDGYFRLVICCSSGKEDGGERKGILCGSPVFRVASTSKDISVVRGASMATMPLEVGIKVASTIGQQWAQRYTALAGGAVQSGVGAVANSRVRSIGQKAYESYQVAGVEDRVNESWENARAVRYEAALESAMLDAVAPVDVVGNEAGPVAPFPVKFDGAVVRGLGTSRRLFGFPTANLSGVSDTVKVNMRGVFAAWACVLPDKDAQKQGVSPDWHEAVVNIGLAQNAGPKVVAKTAVTVHIINDFDEVVFFGSRVKVLLMGYLRKSPSMACSSDDAITQALDSHARDVMVTVASLGRENWGLQGTLDKIKMQKGERNMTQRLDSAAGKVSAQVDRVPVHWAGVRSESSMMRDKMHGTGGLWIAR